MQMRYTADILQPKVSWAYRAMYPTSEQLADHSRLNLPNYGAPYFPEPLLKDQSSPINWGWFFNTIEIR